MHARANTHDIRVVVFAGELRRFNRPRKCRTNAGDLVCGNLFTVTGATHHHAERTGLANDGLSSGEAEGRVVVFGVVNMSTVVDDIVAPRAQVIGKGVLCLEGGMVGSNMDPHSAILSRDHPPTSGDGWSSARGGFASVTGLGATKGVPVSGHNLSKIEAAGRANLLHVEHYDIHLDLRDVRTSPTFRSTTTVTFSATAGGSTWIDLVADEVMSVQLNGVELATSVFANDQIALHDLADHNTLVVDARCKYTRDGTGLHRFFDPVDNEAYLYTQFEVPDARQVYANFEQPDLKAEFSFTVIAPNHWEVVSNGAEESRAQIADGVDQWKFARTKRMSTYITAIVAGPYHHVHDEYRGTYGTYPLGLYCRKSLAEYLDHEELFKITKQGFAFFEDQFKFGYPFGKYDQLFCPEYNAGAMENAGAVTFLEDYVFRSRVTRLQYEARANTILHEMAHMWFGDLVTMKWWEDLWLNESFAEWAAYWSMARCTEFTDAWTEFLGLRKEWGYRQDQQPTTHPIAAEMVDLDSVRPNFDGISYAKGASVLKQLVAYIGEDAFVTGVRNYLQKHQYANAELSDLLNELTAASGVDLKDWMNVWIQTPGVNTLRLEAEVDSDGIYTKALLHQEPAKEPAGLEPVLRGHRLQLGFYNLVNGALTCTDRMWITADGAITELTDQLVGRPRPEVLLINEGDHTFAKIRLDRHSMSNAITHYGAITDSLARTLIWMAAWDMTRDGELPTREWVTLVKGAINSEPEVSVIGIMLRYTKLAVDSYGNPARRGSYYKELADAYFDAAQNAEPGSDLQLAYVRGLLAFATEHAHLAWIESLLTGEGSLKGLAVDIDLRWGMLGRLTTTGYWDPSKIEEEVARDNTAFGQQAAAAARAAVPTADAKAAAWRILTEDDDVANAIYQSTAMGFRQAEQLDLLEPYVARYFVDVESVFKKHDIHVAENFGIITFPSLFVEDATVQMADQFLASHADGNVAMLRFVKEGRANTIRAIRARQADL